MIKQITCVLLLTTSLMANAQNKEVKIIKKSGKGNISTIDSNVNVNISVDTNINTNVNLSIVIDGDNITINGKPADKNDPRLKIMKGNHMMRLENLNKRMPIESITDSFEISDDVMDMEMAPPPPPANAAYLGVITEANEKGAKVNTVSEASPAAKAGLRQNDIIKKVNDQNIDGPAALYNAIGKFNPEDKITVFYIRDGKELKVTVQLAKNKATETNQGFTFIAPNGQMPNNLRRGFRISPDQNFNIEIPEMPELDGLVKRMNKKPKLGISIEDLESGEGVKIKSVASASPAEKAGLKANDIITQFDDKKVTDVSDLKWEYLQEGQVLKFNINRNGEKKAIEVKIPKKLKSADL
jgi:serine protease Do